MPILAASAMITGTIALSTARTSEIIRTFLHAAASHLPSPFVSYFEPFIAFWAREVLPESFGVRYGSYSDRMLCRIGFGTMCVAMSPAVGPPQPLRSACLSMIRFIALRTWMSSNGGCVRFIVMYQVRSPTFCLSRLFRLGVVRYLRRTTGDGLETSSSSWPAATLL